MPDPNDISALSSPGVGATPMTAPDAQAPPADMAPPDVQGAAPPVSPAIADASNPQAPPPTPHGHERLLSMIQGLSIGLSNFGKSMGSGGKEGGASGVINDLGEIQRQTLAKQQAAQAKKNAQLQNDLTIAQTHEILFNTIQNQTMIGPNVEKAQLSVAEGRLTLQQKAQDMWAQGVVPEGYDVDPSTGQVSPLSPQQKAAGTPSAANTAPVPRDGQYFLRAQSVFDAGVQAIKAANGGKTTPIVDANQKIMDDPKSAVYQIQRASLAVQQAAGLSDATVKRLKDVADSQKSQREAAVAGLPKTLEDATAQEVQAHQAYITNHSTTQEAVWNNAKAQRTAAYNDKVAEMARQAKETALATGKDTEAMIKTGINPITKERLSLSNAPDAALVNTHGTVVPTDEINLFKPTPNEKQTADTARQVLAISADLRSEIQKNPNIIGPLMGRDSKAMSKLGLSDRDTQRLLNDVSLLQSAATKMHTGRFSNEILNKMGAMLGPQMNADQFRGGLDSIDEVAGRYAKEDQLVTVAELNAMRQGGTQSNQKKTSVANPSAIPGLVIH